MPGTDIGPGHKEIRRPSPSSPRIYILLQEATNRETEMAKITGENALRSLKLGSGGKVTWEEGSLWGEQ